MNKYIIDDDFLYDHMKSAENIILENLPKEYELSHKFSNGFKIIEQDINHYEHLIYWENDEGIEIMFEQAKITANSIITDTEGIDIEELLIGEQKIIYFTNKNVNQIYWNDSNYIYTIISEYDKNELLKMVESIINNK